MNRMSDGKSKNKKMNSFQLLQNKQFDMNTQINHRFQPKIKPMKRRGNQEANGDLFSQSLSKSKYFERSAVKKICNESIICEGHNTDYDYSLDINRCKSLYSEPSYAHVKSNEYILLQKNMHPQQMTKQERNTQVVLNNFERNFHQRVQSQIDHYKKNNACYRPMSQIEFDTHTLHSSGERDQKCHFQNQPIHNENIISEKGEYYNSFKINKQMIEFTDNAPQLLHHYHQTSRSPSYLLPKGNQSYDSASAQNPLSVAPFLCKDTSKQKERKAKAQKFRYIQNASYIEQDFYDNIMSQSFKSGFNHHYKITASKLPLPTSTPSQQPTSRVSPPKYSSHLKTTPDQPRKTNSTSSSQKLNHSSNTSHYLEQFPFVYKQNNLTEGSLIQTTDNLRKTNQIISPKRNFIRPNSVIDHQRKNIDKSIKNLLLSLGISSRKSSTNQLFKCLKK